MKVLHVTADWKWTGPAEPMLNLTLGLRSRGHGVEIACPPAPEGYSGSLADHCRARGLHPLLLFERRQGYWPLRDRSEVRRLRETLGDGDYDVVHVHHTRDHLIAWRATRGLRTALVLSWHSGEPLPRAPWHRFRLSPRMADGFVALSPGIAASARAIGWTDERLDVVAGAVDAERFRPRARSEPLAKELELDPRHRVLGVVARLQPHRRFDLLLEAFSRAHRELPELRLLVIGRGTRARQVLVEPIRTLGLEGVVVRAGYRRDDYLEVLSLLDALVFLVPGSDGYCRADLETMAMEIPTLASRRGILPETVVDGVTGRLVDEEVSALAGAMLEVGRDPEGWKRRGAAARLRVASHHSPEAQSDRLERLYFEVAGSS